MTEEIEFETYIRISTKVIGIYVFDKKKLKNLYFDEKNYEIEKENNFEILISFIEENIFRIEKSIGKFVNNISLIVDNKKISNLNFCLKKKNYEKNLSIPYIKNIVTEAKDLFKENYQQQKIMHLIIEKYLIDGDLHTTYKKNFKCDNLCLEVKFISINKDFILELERLMERYQIKIINFLDENYVKNIFKENDIELSLMAYKIQSGYNDNEVSVVPKNPIKKGFFEKFFQLFS
jgi:cell division ATPase FtsA